MLGAMLSLKSYGLARRQALSLSTRLPSGPTLDWISKKTIREVLVIIIKKFGREAYEVCTAPKPQTQLQTTGTL